MRGPTGVLIALVAATPWLGLAAQGSARPVARAEVYAGSELETYLRNLQVVGVVGLYPWTVRRFTAAEVDRLLPADSAHPWAARYDWRPTPQTGTSLAWVRPEAVLRTNSGFPYGYNDGPVWAGRGPTLSVQGGLVARYGPVIASVVPLASWAANLRFPLMPNGQPGSLVYADGRFPNSIDHPQRFGNRPYGLVSGGQSTLEASQWGLVAGMSSANDYWGPAFEFPVILGNNAAGIPRAFFGTASPVDLWFARFQLRVIFGRLSQSAYSPEFGTIRLRSGAGAIVSLAPRRPAGLELGVTRFAHYPWRGWSRVADDLSRALRFSTLNDPLENQLVSVFLRWVVPRAGVEVYGEYGTEDTRYDWREIFVEPDHIAGYTIGLRQVSRRPGERLRVIRVEVQNLEPGTLVQSRGQSPFYIHSPLTPGHTNRGQILGSEWGLGGAAAQVAVDWYTPEGRWTVAWSRLLRGAAGDSVATMPQNPRGLDVLHTLGVERLFFRGRYDIRAGATAVYEFNRDFRRDAFNLNVTLGARVSLQ